VAMADFEVPMAPGAVNVLDDILGEGEGLDFDATSPRVGAERLDSTADETRGAADLSESAGHTQEAEEDERTQSRRTVGELVQFVRGSTCPGFTPESICPSLAPTALNPLSNSAARCGPGRMSRNVSRSAHGRTGCRSPA